MVSRLLFSGLVVGVAGQRLWEVAKSRRHERALRERGAREHAPEQMAVMKALHGAWLVSTLAEPWIAKRPFRPALAMVAGAAFVGGQALRISAMRALGDRWTVKIITVPGEPPVAQGVFRHIRHPNYAGVVLEMAALPMMHGAWGTALTFSIANALLLRARIREEERALQAAGTYEEAMGHRPRMFPRVAHVAHSAKG